MKKDERKVESQKIYIWVLLKKKILVDEHGQNSYKIFNVDSRCFFMGM
jgi:hypothetical protein